MNYVGLRVLVADDHAFIAHQLARSLRDAGFEVDLAMTGDDAFALLQQHKYAFLVTDQFMPGKQGLDLIDYVCQQGWETGLILITSHHDNEEVLNRVRAYPKSAVMVKPVSSSKLLSTISMLKDRMSAVAPGGNPVVPPVKE